MNGTAGRQLHPRKRALYGVHLSIACTLGVVAFSGCIGVHEQVTEVGVPVSEEKIKQFVIGRTTRSEVFQSLGPPHSIFRGQVELQQGDVGGIQPMGLGAYYLALGNRHLATLSERQYAVLYRFRQSSSSANVTSFVIVAAGRQTIKIRSDELLLLFNDDTHLLEDVAYRKET
jgi:hypothetical protein